MFLLYDKNFTHEQNSTDILNFGGGLCELLVCQYASLSPCLGPGDVTGRDSRKTGCSASQRAANFTETGF